VLTANQYANVTVDITWDLYFKQALQFQSLRRKGGKFEHRPGPILSVFPALIVHSELKSVHPGFPVAFFKAQVD